MDLDEWTLRLDAEELAIVDAHKALVYRAAELGMLRVRRDALLDACAAEVALRWPGNIFVGLIRQRG